MITYLVILIYFKSLKLFINIDDYIRYYAIFPLNFTFAAFHNIKPTVTPF